MKEKICMGVLGCYDLFLASEEIYYWSKTALWVFFFLSLLISIKVLGEVYLPIGIFIILSTIQILFAGMAGVIYFRRTKDEKNF